VHVSGLIVFIIIGGVAGWLAALIMKGRGLGIGLNIVVGIIGAFIGGWILGLAGFHAVHIVGQVISATIGAVVLLYLARLLR